ncbi:MAG: hypothetical protein V1848_01670 [Candidatus Magasanikbacteria bacterium]
MLRQFYPIKLYILHLPNLIMGLLSILLNASVWVWLVWNIRPQDESIFLHYNILFGVDYIGDWGQMFSLPLIGITIFIVNAFLGWLLFRKTHFAAYLLLAMSVLCQIFLCIAASLLVFLNV